MLIVGSKGFAKELLEVIIQKNPVATIVLYDDINTDLPELLFNRYQIIKNESEASSYLKEQDNRFALGVGDPNLRYKFYEMFTELGGKATTIISPFAKIGKHDNFIQEGCSILTDSIIESNNLIGKGCLLHAGSFISHDVTVGNFCEISPRANVLGHVRIGNFCSLGTASTILPKVKIGNNVIIGAGAVVTKNVMDNMTMIGVPAQPLSK
jgi:sugar O-acyltransferase (sialic acid O-acetyltransferase NeuD family)